MFKILEIKESIFDDNNKQAELLRKELKENKTFNVFDGGCFID